MKVLLDACVPRPLRRFLPDHTVRAAQEMDWGRLKNGALIREAELQFDAFITTDQNLKYQQNLVGRKLAILVLPTNDWATWGAPASVSGPIGNGRLGDGPTVRQKSSGNQIVESTLKSIEPSVPTRATVCRSPITP